jgi:uncharacterized membrane protein
MPADTPPASPLDPSPVRPRLDSVDLLRGLVMVLMALDHTRDYFTNVPFYPLDLDKTNVPLFVTRWITHFCAPVFVFLAGTGAFLSRTRGKTTGDLSRFLFTRGLWLVLLELTYVNWCGWSFNFTLHQFGGAVIWAIGWSMVVLSALVWLPVEAVTIFGLAMIALHNAFDGIKPESFGGLAWLWKILHAGGTIKFGGDYVFGAGYPLIPWIGVMAAGFGFGTILQREPAVRRAWIFRMGAAMTLGFVLLRFSNLYGDSTPWSPQKNFLFTIFSFVHCQKYPPSLCYLLMTLGPAFMLLARLDRSAPKLLAPFLIFGRVPLFYYLLHLPLIHGLAVLVNFVRFGRADWMYGPDPRAAPPPDAGFGLPVVYLAWISVVLVLYLPCRWFAELKRRRRDAWLSYF